MTGFAAALQFLTRVPVRLRREPSIAGAIPWFPVVGGLVGVVVGATAAGLAHVLPAILAGTVAVLLGVLVTGAFHEDGLADVADAFAGGTTVERRLEILKDPRHGSYGVAALAGSILLRAVALGSMPGPAVMFGSAIAAHAVARGAAVGLMGFGRVADANGLGAEHARSASRARSAIGVGAGLVIAAGVVLARFDLGVDAAVCGAAVVAVAVAGTLSVDWLARRKIGGLTGDVLGAVEQVVECAALVVLAGSWPT